MGKIFNKFTSAFLLYSYTISNGGNYIVTYSNGVLILEINVYNVNFNSYMQFLK